MTEIEYTYEHKKRLAKKISDIRDKTCLRKIKKIIETENPKVSTSKCEGGILMCFQKFTNKTYSEIQKCLDEYEISKLKKQTKILSEYTETTISSEDPNVENSDCIDYNVSRTRLRYSNHEKRLIKKKQYEASNNSESDTKKSTVSLEKDKQSIFSKTKNIEK